MPTQTINLNNATPAAPAGAQNVEWQADAPSLDTTVVRNVSAYVSKFAGDSGAGGAMGLVPAPAAGDAAAGKMLKADGTWEAPSVAPWATAPVALAAPNGGTTYALPSAPANPAGSFYFVNGIKRVFGTYYSIAGNTLTLLTSKVPQSGDIHELYAS